VNSADDLLRSRESDDKRRLSTTSVVGAVTVTAYAQSVSDMQSVISLPVASST